MYVCMCCMYLNESLYFAVVAVELPRQLCSGYSRRMQLSFGVAALAEKYFFI